MKVLCSECPVDSYCDNFKGCPTEEQAQAIRNAIDKIMRGAEEEHA